MKNVENQKAKILAEIIYKAIVRYSLAKKDSNSNKKSNLRLECERIWSVNTSDFVDRMEK